MESPEESKISIILNESENVLHAHLNERKALVVLTEDSEGSESLDFAFTRLLALFVEEVEKLFPCDHKLQNFNLTDFEAILNSSNTLLFLSIILSSKDKNEIEDEEEKMADTHTSSLGFAKILETLCNGLLEDNTSRMRSYDVIKHISILRQIKTLLFAFSLLHFSVSDTVPVGFEVVFSQLSIDNELHGILHKIAPKAFQYHIYTSLYRPFIAKFCDTCSDTKVKSDILSALNRLNGLFPSVPDFDSRYERVMRHLGWETWNLEDCCDRIETRTSVLMTESPLEMLVKMTDIWLLLDASKFVTFDNENLQVFCFSLELPVFHEQIMRIFFIINRIDETVRDIGYSAYATGEFKEIYAGLYKDMHSVFMQLVTSLIRNYDIVELECDQATGCITRMASSTVFISSKLKELAIYMTCPLACLDSILRLSLDYTEIPFLFNETSERFVFTCPVQSLLILHDFVANDRVSFAEHMVELYPCLDRHFSRFHKSKKLQSGALNTALPPSYHLFVSKPPTYDAINDVPEIENLNFDNDNECCSVFCSKAGPALFFSFVCLVIMYLVFQSF